MKKLYLKIIIASFGMLAFLIALGWAGDIDYTDQCIMRMSHEEYDTIKTLLTRQYGHEPSERDIAHYWAEHKE